MNKQQAKALFKDTIGDYNIIDFYRMSKWQLKIIVTILMPFILFGWLFWLIMSSVFYLVDIGLKDI